MHPFPRKEIPRAPRSGSLDLPTTERYGGPQHAEEAGIARSQDGVPQDPRGRVKAGLPEVQSRSEYTQSRRDTDSTLDLSILGPRRNHVIQDEDGLERLHRRVAVVLLLGFRELIVRDQAGMLLL